MKQNKSFSFFKWIHLIQIIFILVIAWLLGMFLWWNFSPQLENKKIKKNRVENWLCIQQSISFFNICPPLVEDASPIVTLITYYSNHIAVPESYKSVIRIIEVGDCETCLNVTSIFQVRNASHKSFSTYTQTNDYTYSDIENDPLIKISNHLHKNNKQNQNSYAHILITSPFVAYLGRNVRPGKNYWEKLAIVNTQFSSNINFVGLKILRKRNKENADIIHSYGIYPYFAGNNSVHLQKLHQGMQLGFGKSLGIQKSLLVDPLAFIMKSKFINHIDYESFGEEYSILDLCLTMKHVELKFYINAEIIVKLPSLNYSYEKLPEGGYYFSTFDYSKDIHSNNFYKKWSIALRIFIGNSLKLPYKIVYEIGNTGCSGWFREALDVTTSLEGTVPLRVIADPNKKCHGLPESQEKSLNRLISHTFENIDVWISQKPPTQYPLFPYNDTFYFKKHPRLIIGRSMHETSLIPEDWVDPANKLVDEIWVPSKFLLHSFAKRGISEKKLHVIPFPIDTNFFDPYSTKPMILPGSEECSSEHTFKFLSIFKWEIRRAPEILIEAYFKSFKKNDPVCLFLVTYIPNSNSQRDITMINEKIKNISELLNLNENQLPKFVIINETISTYDMPSLYKAVDSFVMATRGEGWGLPFIEAMSMGLPTIGTNFGGQCDFMNYTNSYLIEYDKVDPETDFPIYDSESTFWAKPKVNHLIEVMQRVVNNKKERELIGKNARQSIKNIFSKEVVAKKIRMRIRHLMKNLKNKN